MTHGISAEASENAPAEKQSATCAYYEIFPLPEHSSKTKSILNEKCQTGLKLIKLRMNCWKRRSDRQLCPLYVRECFFLCFVEKKLGAENLISVFFYCDFIGIEFIFFCAFFFAHCLPSHLKTISSAQFWFFITKKKIVVENKNHFLNTKEDCI